MYLIFGDYFFGFWKINIFSKTVILKGIAKISLTVYLFLPKYGSKRNISLCFENLEIFSKRHYKKFTSKGYIKLYAEDISSVPMWWMLDVEKKNFLNEYFFWNFRFIFFSYNFSKYLFDFKNIKKFTRSIRNTAEI